MKKNNAGFTLAELVIVTGILAIIIAGMMRLFIYTSIQADMAGNITVASSEAQNKIEEIRRHDFDLIMTDYASGGTPGNTFDLFGGSMMGTIYTSIVKPDPCSSCTPELIEIEVVMSFENKTGRVIGEDTNLNGVIDSGEDLDSDGKFDSKVSLITMITRK